MAGPKPSRLELKIMETLSTKREVSIREIQEAFPEKGSPGYTTIQTTVYCLEGKKAVRDDTVPTVTAEGGVGPAGRLLQVSY